MNFGGTPFSFYQMRGYTSSRVRYSGGILSLGDASWKQACSCSEGILPHPSRLLAENTILRKDLGKECQGLAFLTHSQNMQGCLGPMWIVCLKAIQLKSQMREQL